MKHDASKDCWCQVQWVEPGRVEQAEEGARWNCNITGLALFGLYCRQPRSWCSRPHCIQNHHQHPWEDHECFSSAKGVFDSMMCNDNYFYVHISTMLKCNLLWGACCILCFARNGGTIAWKQAQRHGHHQHLKRPSLLWRFWRVTPMLWRPFLLNSFWLHHQPTLWFLHIDF